MKIRIGSWMFAAAVVASLGGCGGAEEDCSQARVEAQGVWESYVTALDEAHEARERDIEVTTQSQLELVRRQDEECRSRARDEVAAAAHAPIEEDPSPPAIEGRRGSLSREAILGVVAAHRAEARSCYEQELQRDPSIGGRILVFFVVGPTGVVESAEVGSSSMNNATVESCIVEAARGWSFPEPEDNGSVSVSYPFIFRAPRSCPTLEHAEAEARRLVIERRAEPPDQTQARDILALITGGTAAFRDAVQAFRSDNSGSLVEGPPSEPAFEAAEATWQACQAVDP